MDREINRAKKEQLIYSNPSKKGGAKVEEKAERKEEIDLYGIIKLR
jgi:hypothetical protein